MYCRNCGKEIADNAAVCVNCGVSVGKGEKYCPNCASETSPDAAVCVKCGVALKKTSDGKVSTGVVGDKSKIAAGLFAIFLGHLGIHKFYLGEKKEGLIKIIATVVSVLAIFVCFVGVFMLIAVWIWNLYDAYCIFSGKTTDAEGNELS